MRRILPHSSFEEHRLRPCTPSGRLGAYCDTAFLDHLKVIADASSTTIAIYRSNLKCFQRYLAFQKLKVSVHSVQKNDIEQYLRFLDEHGVPYNSRKQKLITLKSFFKYCLGEGYVERSPAALIACGKREMRLPTPAPVTIISQMRRAIEGAIFEGNGSKRHYLIAAALDLIYGSGLRMNEMLKLRYEDLSLSGSGLGPSARLVMTKNRDTRVVPLNRDTMHALARLSPIPIQSRIGLVFGKSPNRRYAHATWDRWMRELQAELQLPKRYRWHDLRASFFSQLAIAGASVPAMMLLGGHHSPASLQHYINAGNKEMFDAYHRFHPLGDKSPDTSKGDGPEEGPGVAALLV